MAERIRIKSKEISEALKLKSQIQNEGNVLLRKARSNHFDNFE